MQITPSISSFVLPQKTLETSSLSGDANALAASKNETRDSKALTAEKEAQAQIAAAHSTVEAAQKDSQSQIETLKDSYVKQYESESARQEAALESQRQKGYQAIRELQKAQSLDLDRVKKQGDHELKTVKSYYSDTIHSNELQGSERLQDIELKNHLAFQSETLKANSDLETNKENHLKRVTILKDKQDQTYEQLAQTSATQLDQVRERNVLSGEMAEKRFQDKHQKVAETYAQELGKIQSQTSKEIENIRSGTAQRLEAYSSRQEDPFYKMMSLESNLEESDDAYQLSVSIPEHEQDHVSVNVHGNQIVVTGYRKNEEKLDLSPGHQQSTSAYQTYSESFPINWPVESKQLSREFVGDQLVIRVPKKGPYAKVETRPKAAPEPVRAERPQFPKNLPAPKSPRSPGDSGTLT